MLLRSIELYGREVIPRVRRLLAKAAPVRAEGVSPRQACSRPSPRKQRLADVRS